MKKKVKKVFSVSPTIVTRMVHWKQTFFKGGHSLESASPRPSDLITNVSVGMPLLI